MDEDEQGEFSLQLELGGKSGDGSGDKLTEEELRERRRIAKADRALQQLQHRTSTLCLLARGLLLDQAASQPAIGAAMLSLAPSHLLPAPAPSPCSAASLGALAAWMLRTFEVVDDLDFCRYLPSCCQKVGSLYPTRLRYISFLTGFCAGL